MASMLTLATCPFRPLSGESPAYEVHQGERPAAEDGPARVRVTRHRHRAQMRAYKLRLAFRRHRIIHRPVPGLVHGSLYVSVPPGPGGLGCGLRSFPGAGSC